MFQSGNFKMFFFATVMTTIGEGIFGLTSLVMVSQNSNLIFSISLFFVLTALPSIFLAPLQGVLIDRFDKTKLCLFSNLVRGLVVSIVAFTVWADLFSMPIFYCCVLLYYIQWYFLVPTIESMIKDVVSESEAVSGMALIQAALQVGVLGSAVLAGVMMDYIGSYQTLALAAVIDVVSGFIFTTIILNSNPSIHRNDQVRLNLYENTKVYLNDIHDGWMYIMKDYRLVLLVIIAASAHPFYQAINTLVAPFNFSILKGTSSSLGLIETGAGVGSLAASAICVIRFGQTTIQKIMLISQICLVFSVLIFSWSNTIITATFMYVLIGVFSSNMKILSKSFILEIIHQKYSGRVMSTISLIGLSIGVMVSLIIGGVADHDLLIAYGYTAIFVFFPITATLLWLISMRRDVFVS